MAQVSDLVQICHEAVRVDLHWARGSAWRRAHLRTCLFLPVKLDVFLVNSRQNEWDARDAAIYVSLRGAKVDE